MNQNKMGCFNDPAWKVCGGVGWWLTPTTYIQLAGAGSTARRGWINIYTLTIYKIRQICYWVMLF